MKGVGGFALLVAAGACAQDVRVVPVRGNVYLIAGAGGNIAASVGAEGVLLVDSGTAAMADKVLAAVNQIANAVNTKGMPNVNVGPSKPVRIIINTHMHPDHTGGNEKLAKSGKTFTGGNVAGTLADAAGQSAIYAHENTMNRMQAADMPFPALPTDTYHVESMYLSHFFNGEGVQIFHQPNAHTDGDSIVYFRGSDVIATGDVFSTTSYPVVDLQRGGGIDGVIAALNRILDLAVPEFRSEGGTMIVPGHGRICDMADVAYYRDMVTVIRDRVLDALKRGRTLEQTKAEKLTMDYDGRYGSSDVFIDAVYRSLSQRK